MSVKRTEVSENTPWMKSLETSVWDLGFDPLYYSFWIQVLEQHLCIHMYTCVHLCIMGQDIFGCNFSNLPSFVMKLEPFCLFVFAFLKTI